MRGLKKGRVALAVVAAMFSLGLFTAALGAFPEEAEAATPVNYGDPFENGDLTSWYGIGYRMAGVQLYADGITHLGAAPPPFPYPQEFVARANQGNNGWGAWGVSDFQLRGVRETSNTRNLNYSSVSMRVHCVQYINETTVDLPRPIQLILVQALSGYNEDKSVYHGVFVSLVHNAHDYDIWDQATVGVEYVYADWIIHGKGKLVKSSANPSITKNNACYSLEGAVYGIYSDSDATQSVGTFTTNAKGKSDEVELSPGTYYVKEKTAPVGYALSEKVYKMKIKGGETTTLEIEDVPIRNPLGIVVSKIDAQTAAGRPQGSATLQGARFNICYYDGYYNANTLPDTPTRSWVVETDADGTAKLDEAHTVSGGSFYFAKYVDGAESGDAVFPLGTVTVQEIRAPEGYICNSEVTLQTITAEGAEGSKVTVYSCPEIPNAVIRGDVGVYKVDEIFGATPSGDGILAGALFEVVNNSPHSVVNPSGNEIGKGGVVCSVRTDSSGYAKTEGGALAYGDYILREAQAPTGYLLNSGWSYSFSIRSQGELHTATQSCANEPMKGRLILGKIDRENGSYTPQGRATLAGAQFEIVNESQHSVYVGGAAYYPGSRVMLLQTQELDGRFLIDTGERALPYGTYIVREIASSPGYLFDSESAAWQRRIEIREDGQVCDFSSEDEAISNLVIRGDFSFNKVVEASMERLAGAPFLVTSNTTGEHHVIVSDPNGEAGTNFAPHSHNTNANDAALQEDGSVDESLLDFEAGVWFDGSEKAAQLSDSRGALPYDIYTVRELPVEANAGLKLVEFTIDIYREQAVNGGTIDDGTPLWIGTTLTAQEGTTGAADGHEAYADAQIVLTDEVEYGNAEVGKEYTMKGELHVVSSDGQDEGVVAQAETKFTPKQETGNIALDFTLDASQLGGKSTVAFEYAYDAQGTLVASHENIADKGQTVSIKPEEPAIEKYINQDVHQDVLHDEIFTYSILAYIPRNADYACITDTLVDNLAFAEGAEAVVVCDLGSENNHLTNGSYTAYHEDATVALSGESAVPLEAKIGIEGQKLQVDIEDATALRGHWLRVEFSAHIAIDADYTLISAEENTPVISFEEHLGIPNNASYTVGVGDNPACYGGTSNTVTVKPEEPAIEKYVEQDVHYALNTVDEIYTYQILAYITRNAVASTIFDDLVENLAFACNPEDVVVEDIGEENNHATHGAYSGHNEGASVASAGVALDADIRIAGSMLSVYIADAVPLRGHWVRVTFKARVVQDGGYTDIDASHNAPVVSSKAHTGIPNQARYTIDTKQKSGAYERVSNIVTVTPPSPEPETPKEPTPEEPKTPAPTQPEPEPKKSPSSSSTPSKTTVAKTPSKSIAQMGDAALRYGRWALVLTVVSACGLVLASYMKQNTARRVPLVHNRRRRTVKRARKL